jgi:phage terminase large subunit-like protein
MTTTEQAAVIFPSGVDGRRVLGPLNHPLWAQPGPNGRAYRVEVTRRSPVRFALTYLSHYLRQQETGVLSFSSFHLDLARSAIRWIEPVSYRDAWVAPRGASKSVWLYLILPLWALAHKHRRFFLSFSANGSQATGHLGHIRREIDVNELLLADFPDLAPATFRGARNTHQTVTASGATLATRGMGETSLGLRSSSDRPDLIIGDDLEPGEADYTPAAKEKQLRRLVNNIFPMGAKSTVVQITGTVTMYESIMHDTVLHVLGRKSAPWIVESTPPFECHYYPPIITDPDGSRRSLWPQRWSLAELEAMEGTRQYDLNYRNDPSPGSTSGSAYWNDDLIRYRPPFIPTRRGLFIDVAVTKKASSDYTALVVVGSDKEGRRASVEHAEAGRLSGAQIRERIWRWGQRYPETLQLVRLESNQGGDIWKEILNPLPHTVELQLQPESKSKRARTMDALDHYEAMAVWHHRPLSALEDQLKAWPNVKNDDLIDAVSAGIQWALGDVE